MIHTSSCAKFRCGVAPLQIELGRYIGQPEYNRLCPMCQNDVGISCVDRL